MPKEHSPLDRGLPIRAISRSIAVLQAINRGKSLSLQEIALSASLPYPTAFRIVQTLMIEGLIECEPYRKLYRATALVQTLSHGFQNHDRMVTLAHPHLLALTEEALWPAAITTRVGTQMMIRDSTHFHTSLTFNNYYPGHTQPILECSSGHAYLAHAADDERSTLLKGLRTLETSSETLSMFESGKLVRRIREAGFATMERNRYTANPGKTSSISAPIFDNGRVLGTITLIFFASAMPMKEAMDRYADIVKTAAARINEQALAK
ncbi:MAG: helix-turn-helix domain-containing protein [Pseudomonadota bacterium]